MDFGMMAGGMAEGMSPLPGLMMEGRKMAQQQSQFEQEHKIKKATLLIEMLKDPNIPSEVKESHIYPQYQQLWNGLGMTQLPDMPQGAWGSQYNKYFSNMSKVVQDFHDGKPGRDLNTTIGIMDAYKNNLVKAEDVKRAEQDMQNFMSKNIMAGVKGYKEQAGPVPESGEALAPLPQQMTREEQDLAMTRLSPENREFISKTRDKMKYVTPDGKEQYLAPNEYNQVMGYSQHDEFNTAMRALKKQNPNISDLDAVKQFEAMKATVQKSINPPEWKARYDSYVATCKKAGIEPDPLEVFTEKSAIKVAGAKMAATTEAHITMEQEMKKKKREGRKAATSKDDIKK